MELGHNFFVAYAEETAAPTETSDGITAATFATLPGSMVPLAWTNVPEQHRGLNNSLGYATNSPEGQYIKRGTVTPSLTIALRAGALGLLQKAVRITSGAGGFNTTVGTLPNLVFWVGVPGVWTGVYRMAKVGKLQMQGRDSENEAAEIEANLEIQAQGFYLLASPLSPAKAAFSATAAPLLWTDVRAASLSDRAGTPNVYQQRTTMTGFQATIDHQLIRGVTRPHFGDDVPTSRTSSELKEGIIQCSGEFSLNKEITGAMYQGTANALAWGPTTLALADYTNSKKLGLTFNNSVPTDPTIGATEPGAPLMHTIPFLATSVTADIVP